MWISPSDSTRQSRKLGLSLLLISATTVFFGCANPGPPKPPSLNLPSPVKDLRAERIGEEVRLAWTTPADTTDNLALKPPLSAEICRDAFATAPAAACTVVRSLPVKSGPTLAADPLPAPLLADPVQVLRYRVRLLNAAGHAADASNSALAASGSAPPPIAGLHASPSPDGTRILWQPVSVLPAAITLERTEVSSAVSPGAPIRPAAKPSVPRKDAARGPVQLQASPAGPDLGGTIDVSAERGATYRYIAWRTRPVVVGGRPLSLRSPDSSPLLLTVTDTTPPATPAGLEAVADAGSVDLSWEPDTDVDLAGYWIERADLPETASSPSGGDSWHRLNPVPILSPAYRDASLLPAHSYRYRVLAGDGTGNLSPPSPPVTVTLRPF